MLPQAPPLNPPLPLTTITATAPVNNPGDSVSVALIGAVIGGVAGSLLMLAFFLLLLLALVWMTKKYKRAANLLHQQEQPEGKEQREAIYIQQYQETDDATEMKSNDAYISTTQQIPMADNVAYGQIESDQDVINEYDYI